MTVDDLHSIFKAARQGTREWNGTEWVGEWHGDRAGVTAIVRALRDEMCVFYEDEMVIRDTWELYQEFNEILGVAESEKASGSGPASVHTQEQRPDPQVAGGANTVDAQQCQTNTTPATDAAPAVCVWTETSIDPLGYAWLNSSCGLVDCHERDVLMQPDPQKHCPSCGKPIKFTEAK